MYMLRSPWWLKKIYADSIWRGDLDNSIYLTFDDGPHPHITPFVLELLKRHDIKATFFCIGKNVQLYPDVYRRIIDEGHTVGNHTHTHKNGWKTDDRMYLEDIAVAKKYIDSNLFRPPYGRITRFQLRQLKAQRFDLKCVMWSLLSGDFDVKLSPEKCLNGLLLNVRGGDIVVFHDSEKAFDRLRIALPSFIDFCIEKNFAFNVVK